MLKSFFRHIGWVLAGYIGLCPTLVFAEQFTAARILTLLVAIYAFGAWRTSQTLETKRNSTSRILGPDGDYIKVKSKSKSWWETLPIIGIVVTGLLIGHWIRIREVQKELDALSGWLYPANEDVHPQCSVTPKPDDLVLMGGTNAYFADRFPHTLIMFGCEKVLVLDRDENGNVGVSLKIKDREGKVVVLLEKGRFTINRNNYLTFERPNQSPSTLLVKDQKDEEVLYLHLANRHVLQIRAKFYYQGQEVKIDELHPFGAFGGNTFLHSCFGYSYVAEVQIGQCLVQ